MRHLLHHCFISSAAACLRFASCRVPSAVKIRAVSSANLKRIEYSTMKYFMDLMKNVGESTLPCAKPIRIGKLFEWLFPLFMNDNLLLEKSGFFWANFLVFRCFEVCTRGRLSKRYPRLFQGLYSLKPLDFFRLISSNSNCILYKDQTVHLFSLNSFWSSSKILRDVGNCAVLCLSFLRITFQHDWIRLVVCRWNWMHNLISLVSLWRKLEMSSRAKWTRASSYGKVLVPWVSI